MRQVVVTAILALLIGTSVCALNLAASIRPFPDSLIPKESAVSKMQVLDSLGNPLSFTYKNSLNVHNLVSLHNIPNFLKLAFVEAEDRRFFSHRGPDWLARGAALIQNISAMRTLRGASTISEQSVRLLHPRPRTLWSRFVEGFEARNLEGKFGKEQVLEFYLNQVPYASNRRGVEQASFFYFDRSLKTLSKHEMLALATLVRAPTRLDPWKNPSLLKSRISRLSKRMLAVGMLSSQELEEILSSKLELKKGLGPLNASHFVQHVLANTTVDASARVQTSLKASLQQKFQHLLDSRVEMLSERNVRDAALLVVENKTGRILSWVNAEGVHRDKGSSYDAVTLPRQAGSTLKPFLYALALEKGYTAATLIDDSPFETPVGFGLHSYRNYSGRFYGALRLREALGNSLNTPALRTLQFVGGEEFVSGLREFGFKSLGESSAYYGEGIALGNAEVSLYELVGAYRSISNGGQFNNLTFTASDSFQEPVKEVISSGVASIVSDILSDSNARRREFGSQGILNFPIQTAVKTGTTNDYRDAWALGFSSEYTAGVWMGNLDREAMSSVSGSSGPALVLRAVFSELSRLKETSKLFLSPELLEEKICAKSGKLAGEHCPGVKEYFILGTQLSIYCNLHSPDEHRSFSPELDESPLKIVIPSPGLRLAIDPRIPRELQVLKFQVRGQLDGQTLLWELNGEQIARTKSENLVWQLESGHKKLRVGKVSKGSLQNQVVVKWSSAVSFFVR